MSDWIPVDLGAEERAQKAFIRGVEVELFASPYDVPEAIRGHFDEAKNRLIIELRYVGSEPTKVCVYNHVSYTIGESSNRLYGLEIDVHALKVDGIGLSLAPLQQRKGQELSTTIRDQVTGAIDFLLERQPLDIIHENYKLAKDAILAKQDQLFAVA